MAGYLLAKPAIKPKREGKHGKSTKVLNSGEYRFEARALTADRNYSKSAIVAFQIATPVWKRGWFIALMMILTALTGYFFYKNRLLRLLEMERMRTRIATDLNAAGTVGDALSGTAEKGARTAAHQVAGFIALLHSVAAMPVESFTPLRPEF